MFWGSLTQELEVLAILKGGCTKLPLFERGGGGARKVLPCLEEGAQKVSDLRFNGQYIL